MPPATQNAPASFQLALPHLLAPISPSLAALHATRVRRISPAAAHASLAGTHCVNCGYPLIASDSQTRSVRKRRKRHNGRSRVLRRSCRSCGHDEDVPLTTGADAPTFPMPRNRAKRESGNSTDPPRACSAAAASPAQMAPSTQDSSEPRSYQPTASSSTPVPSRPGSAASARSSDQLHPSRPSSVRSTKVSSAAQDPQRAKARTKKKTGLQSMLARNRERQDQEKQREEGHSHGLSAFLQGL